MNLTDMWLRRRRLPYQTAKEARRSLPSTIGAGVGVLLGLLAARWGYPEMASVLAGAFLGSPIGTVANYAVVATRLRRWERAARRDPVAAALADATDALAEIADDMRRSHDTMLQLLSGTRSGVIDRANRAVTLARTRVDEARSLLTKAGSHASPPKTSE